MEHITCYIVFTLITVLGLVANVAALYIFLRNREKFPKISRMLLQNQAVADICVCVLGIGMYTHEYWDLYMSKNAVFDSILCQTWHSQAVYWISVLVSVWALVLLAIERFLMVVYPYAHRNIKEKQIYQFIGYLKEGLDSFDMYDSTFLEIRFCLTPFSKPQIADIVTAKEHLYKIELGL